MSHDSERDAGAYLGGAMSGRRETAFEKHLLECEDCWREVADGRRGRALVESTREIAPASMREDLRAMIAAQPVSQRRTMRTSWAAVAAVIVVVLIGATTFFVAQRSHQPAAITEAVADFRTGRIPVAGTPKRPAPNLTTAGLSLVSEGSGNVGVLGVDAYAYRDSAGNQVLVYVSEKPFPVAAGAIHADGPAGPWRARVAGVNILCAQRPHALLLLSRQEGAMMRAASALGVW